MTFEETFSLPSARNFQMFLTQCCCWKVINRFHEAGKSTLDSCKKGLFADALHDYVYHRQSPCFLRKFFVELCKKCLQGFDDSFSATKKRYFYFFSKLQGKKIKKGTSSSYWKKISSTCLP